MAPQIEDRWLWLGLGIFTFLAAKGVSHGLRHIVHLTEVHQAPLHPTLPLPKLGKEDAIKTSSLETLATCDNVEIRKAATKILCERFHANGPARRSLLRDLGSDNPKVEHKAQLAFNLLYENGVLTEPDPAPITPRAQSAGGALIRRSLPWLPAGTRNPDVEERNLRRRRREAMVINEGDRPVSQEDVWMRNGEGEMNTGD
ncbi:hypothetical protein BDV95DRAFT_629899 [Massariosphaeria phaeospora]|uniref:Uncharacterized protein n=1 Tax=Massariosphaeria phaeospora TaxID=100035 RepID=A0A7C8MBU2_9PLEO|nr:hypothetical protein BDV95DRAFT_629899 [Massariosphaeria phaeospora]